MNDWVNEHMGLCSQAAPCLVEETDPIHSKISWERSYDRCINEAPWGKKLEISKRKFKLSLEKLRISQVKGESYVFQVHLFNKYLLGIHYVLDTGEFLGIQLWIRNSP